MYKFFFAGTLSGIIILLACHRYGVDKKGE
jgi:hypothetical protein